MADERPKIENIRFIYHKARHHRTFHADGMWASVTPQLEVQFALFNNLKPMPVDEVRTLRPDGTLGEGKETPGEQHVVREVDATVVMNRETIRSSIELLQRMLTQIDQAIESDKKLRADGQASEVSQDAD
jgi:hypothetical protein